ncbi:MAG: ATP-dependent Clp protease ATP-binding subunit, partial [Acidobacteria bacterium]|nr:ATP-dependent Clp protease ATP-binding subunit [Acidobacteriota bacterium]
IIIMTSNIGARFIEKKAAMGFQSQDLREVQRSVTDMVLGEVKRTFNPEFINRVDELIVFEPLSDDDLRRIIVLLVDGLNTHLVQRKLSIELAPGVADWIIEITCADRSYGARPLRRAIQRYIEDPLSEALIRGQLRAGRVEVYLEDGALSWRAAGGFETGRPLAATV